MKSSNKEKVQWLAFLGAIMLTGCTAPTLPSPDTSGSSGSGSSGSSSVLPTYPELLTAWIINDTDETAAYIINDDGTSNANKKALVNVQSVTSDNTQYVRVNASGIPNYSFYITQDQVDWLNARPKAASGDFRVGTTTTATAGQLVEFGTDINYNGHCNSGEGLGWWPPGPVCPTNQSKSSNFPLEPTVNAADDCTAGLGALGYAINGASIYGWSDGQKVAWNAMQSRWKAGSTGTFETLAPKAEVYDVDLCGGHAASGDYHHHFYSKCWADVTEENSATTHSAVFGFAADGYPVYGPYYDKSNGTLAQSCWVKRVYTDYGTGTNTGCADGTRSCVMVDPYDPSQGTTTSGVVQGPGFTDTYYNLSGNAFTAANGSFYEDYYYSSTCTALGGEHLDQHNGHYVEGLGYHYHLTIDADGNAVFPFTIGPKFKGELPSTDAVASCGGGGGGGGGMPPPP